MKLCLLSLTTVLALAAGCGSDPSFLVFEEQDSIAPPSPDAVQSDSLDAAQADTGLQARDEGPESGLSDGGFDAPVDAPTETSPPDAVDAPPPDACGSPHANGLGQTYAFCAPLGAPGDPATYSVEMARAARAAWPEAGTDLEGACATGDGRKAVWRKTADACAGWLYTTTMAGHVYLGTTSCSCPDGTHPVWK